MLVVGIVSLIVFFLRVAIIINAQIMMSRSEDAREPFGQGYFPEDYFSGYSFSADLRRQVTLLETESMFNLLFFLSVGIGCIIAYFGTQTTKERRFGKPENPQETEETGTTDIYEHKAEKSVKPLTEKTKGRIVLLSGLVFILVYSWQLLSLLSSPRLDVMRFVMPFVYALVVACPIGIIAYTIVKYRIVEFE